MRNRHLRFFGVSSDAWPVRFSNVRLARLDWGDERGCSYCFPHRMEVENNKWMKDLRCWKRYRSHQYHGFVTQRRLKQHMRYVYARTL